MKTISAAVLSLCLLIVAPVNAQVHVDINGPHVVLRSAEPQDWKGIAIELNDHWTFTVSDAARGPDICVNARAFIVKASARVPGNDYQGVRFDPQSMKVKTAKVSSAGSPFRIESLTSGMIKPLTTAQAARCLG